MFSVWGAPRKGAISNCSYLLVSAADLVWIQKQNWLSGKPSRKNPCATLVQEFFWCDFCCTLLPVLWCTSTSVYEAKNRVIAVSRRTVFQRFQRRAENSSQKSVRFRYGYWVANERHQCLQLRKLLLTSCAAVNSDTSDHCCTAPTWWNNFIFNLVTVIFSVPMLNCILNSAPLVIFDTE